MYVHFYVHEKHSATPYDPDDKPTMGAICRLQAAGLPIVNPVMSGYSQTWGALFGVFEQLGLQDLSQQVERVLRSKCETFTLL